MRFHILGNPNAPITSAYRLDGFSQATLRLCRLLKTMGDHEVFLYGAVTTTAPCTEFIQTVDADERRAFSAPFAYQDVPFDPASELWRMSNRRTIDAIQKRKQAGDFLLTIGGYAHKPVFDAFPNLLGVEWSVGYIGSFAQHRVFESYAWQHHTYGKQGITNGRFYDDVIPLFFDVSEFPIVEDPEDYLLYVGRLTHLKGISVACQIATAAGVKLKVVGHGDKSLVTGGHEYLGALSHGEKIDAMSRAKAVLCPTLYIEPFNAVAVEAQLCGTPVICPDFGGFTETVGEGCGHRCHLLRDFVAACHNLDHLDRWEISQRARHLYGFKTAARRYARYFERVQTRLGAGWESEWV